MQHMPEWRIFIIVFLGMLLCIVLAEVFRKLLKLSPEFSRKFVHVSIGLIIFFLPKIFIHAFPLLVLGLIFILVNSIALRKEWLSGMHGTDRHSFGTVLYPVSFVLLVLFFWDRHPEIAAIAMLVMALGDGTAAIIGEALPSPHFYRLSSDKKSIEGSAAMFLVSFACVFGGLVFYVRDGFSRQMFLPVSLVVALAAAAWEALSSGGWDNCTGTTFIRVDSCLFSHTGGRYRPAANNHRNSFWNVYRGGFMESKISFAQRSRCNFSSGSDYFRNGRMEVGGSDPLLFFYFEPAFEIGEKRERRI